MAKIIGIKTVTETRAITTNEKQMSKIRFIRRYSQNCNGFGR